MSISGTQGPLRWGPLKEKQRSIRAGFPEPLGLRVHRAISWLGRAEREVEDSDVRFVLMWVGFNAACANAVAGDADNERGAFQAYFDAVVALDGGRRIYNVVWTRFSNEIRLLLDNKYVYAPFWNHHNGVEGYADWAERLSNSHRSITVALARQDTSIILSVLFDRL